MLLVKSLAYVIYLVDSKHRKVADQNLRNAYGEDLSDSQRRKIIMRNYLYLGSVGVDFIKLPQIVNSSNWQKHIEVEGVCSFVSIVVDHGMRGHFYLLRAPIMPSWSAGSRRLDSLRKMNQTPRRDVELCLNTNLERVEDDTESPRAGEMDASLARTFVAVFCWLRRSR